MATHSSTLDWRIPDRGAWRPMVHSVTESDTTEGDLAPMHMAPGRCFKKRTI